MRPIRGALLQELIDVAVIMNALRALRPGKPGPVELRDADLALVRRFRSEHASLRPDVDRLVAVADQIGVVTPERALELAQDVRRCLVDELLPHEQAEDTELYPALARVLDDVDNHRLDGEDATDVLRLIYGLPACPTRGRA